MKKRFKIKIKILKQKLNNYLKQHIILPSPNNPNV